MTAPARGRPRVHLPALLAALLLLAALAVTWSLLLPWRAAALILATSLLSAVPGVLAARRLHADEDGGTWLLALCIGPAAGYALSNLVLLAGWLAGLRHAGLLVAAPVVATLIALPIAGWCRGMLRVPVLTRRDLAPLLLLLVIVPAIVGRPYAQVGADTGAGRAWRAYFTADVVWAVAVVAEVSKGDTLPRNPYRLGDSLHYYWLAHLTPAIQHRLLGDSVPIHSMLLANAVLSGLAFVAFLFAFARHFVTRGTAAALACVFVILCHSFEGIEQLWTLWSWGAPLDLVQYMNIDAVTRWVYKGMPIDGLQRLLLYQPQHQIGYALGFSALLILVQARERLRPRVVALVGGFLALSMLISTFAALMLTIVAAVWLGVEVVRRRAWAAGILAATIAAVPLMASVALAGALRYVEHGGALVSLRPNRLALVRWPFMLFLGLGPVILTGGVGVYRLVRTQALARYALSVVVTGVALFFYFLVDVRDHQNVYVGWRAGHLMLIAAIPFVAAALEHLPEASAPGRWTVGVLFGGLALLALPTTAIDLYNSQDITNFGQAPGFHWTLLLTPDEVDALAWLKHETPPHAVVQVDPFVRDAETWAWVPAFAERRMAAGLPISMVPLDKYRRASDRVRHLYEQTSGDQAYLLARALSIDYLVIGPPEALAHPQIAHVLDETPQHWRRVYANPTFCIFARLP